MITKETHLGNLHSMKLASDYQKIKMSFLTHFMGTSTRFLLMQKGTSRPCLSLSASCYHNYYDETGTKKSKKPYAAHTKQIVIISSALQSEIAEWKKKKKEF